MSKDHNLIKKNQVFDNQFCSLFFWGWLIVPALVSCKNRCQTGNSFLSFKSIVIHGVFIFIYIFIYYGYGTPLESLNSINWIYLFLPFKNSPETLTSETPLNTDSPSLSSLEWLVGLPLSHPSHRWPFLLCFSPFDLQLVKRGATENDEFLKRIEKEVQGQCQGTWILAPSPSLAGHRDRLRGTMLAH